MPKKLKYQEGNRSSVQTSNKQTPTKGKKSSYNSGVSTKSMKQSGSSYR